MSQILIVDDEIGIRELLSEILQDEGHEVILAENAAEARERRQFKRPDLVLLDIWMPDTDGITLLKEWAGSGQLSMPVIMMSGHGTIDTAVEATKIGACDFLEKPIALQKLLAAVTRALKRGAAAPDPSFALLNLGKSDVIGDLKKRLDQIYNVRTTLLLTGEPGCGADVCARFLHHAHTPLVELENPQRLADEPMQLLQSARDGVLFVPEISVLNRQQQRGLQLAMNKLDKYGVRLICASTKTLGELANEQYDPWLISQLGRLVIPVPALRDHREDVPDLANMMLTKLVEGKETPLRHFNSAALNALRNFEWPGNLLQLGNAVRTLALTALHEEIGLEETKRVLAQFQVEKPVQALPVSLDQPLREARDAFERLYFEHHIRLEGGNMSRVAEKVGLERTHLYRKLKQLEIRVGKRHEEAH